VFLPRRTPARPLLTAAIFTVQSLRLIRCKPRVNGTESRRPRPERSERDKEPAKYYRRRNFGTEVGAPRCPNVFGRRRSAPSLPSTERKVRLYSRHIRLINARCFAQPALAFCAFYGQQMAPRRTRSQNFPTCCDFEAFGHRFARFAACNGLGHTARKIIAGAGITNSFITIRVRPQKALNAKRHGPRNSNSSTPLRPLGVMLSGAKHL
jgi:hypothetical protein